LIACGPVAGNNPVVGMPRYGPIIKPLCTRVTRKQGDPMAIGFQTGSILRARLWTVVRIGLGLLLLTAAGLKLAGQGVSAVPQVAWFAVPAVQIAAAEWEIVLGLWLLSGAYQIGSWLAAVATFSAFSVVSGYLGWTGVASCGCFGAIHASPWYVFGVDVMAMGTLVIVRAPTQSLSRHDICVHAVRVAGNVLANAGMILAIVGIGSFSHGSTDAALAALRGESVMVEPRIVEFGAGTAGEIREREITLVNRTNKLIRIVGSRSDCGCKLLGELPIYLTAEASVPARVAVKYPAQSAAAGNSERKLFLITDDDGHPILEVRVKVGPVLDN
jgi:hypothetical protein